MKTTIEIPDPLFRRAESTAAERGQTLTQLVTDALREKLANDSGGGTSAQPAWMSGFGELSRLRRETERIQAQIDEAFDLVEPDDRG